MRYGRQPGELVYGRSNALDSFPSAPPPGSAWWVDADDLATLFQDSLGTVPVTADNDPVGAWLDKSGNARHVSQSVAGNKPLYKRAILNGKAGIKFDGTDDVMNFVSSLPAATMNESTTFLVLSGWTTGTVQGLLAGSAATADPYYLRLDATSKPDLLQGYVGGNVGGTLALSTSGAILVCQHSDTNNTYAFQTGRTANGSGASANSFTAATAQLGMQTGGLNEPYSGYVHAGLVYPSLLSVSLTNWAVNYLRGKWGIGL